MKWDIRDVDKPLIEAAISFGEWLSQHPVTSDEQRKHIAAVQTALRAMPAFCEGFKGEYGCHIHNVALMTGLPYAPGVGRGWFIDLNGETLEIASIYKTLPEGDEIADAAHEMLFLLTAGQPNHHIPDYDKWIEEVKDPMRFLESGYYFEVETSLADKTFYKNDYRIRYPDKKAELQRHLHDIILTGDTVAVQRCIEAGADVNAPDSFGTQPLRNAIAYIDEEDVRHQMVELLLKAGADPKRLDEDGSGPLFSAVLHQDTKLLKLLLDSGADPNQEHDLSEPLYNSAEFDYRYDEYDLHLPEQPTDQDKASEENWLQFLDRLALKYGKRRPDYLFLLRAAGAKTWREMHPEPARGENRAHPNGGNHGT